jgi:hypothetical protein
VPTGRKAPGFRIAEPGAGREIEREQVGRVLDADCREREPDLVAQDLPPDDDLTRGEPSRGRPRIPAQPTVSMISSETSKLP